MDEILLRENHGPVATLTLNRPDQLNALSEELMTALQAALDAIADEPTTKVVILKGALGRAPRKQLC